MNIIFKNWLEINGDNSFESLNSDSNSIDLIHSDEDISNKVLILKKELKNAEKINYNLKLTIDHLDKKINKIIIENKFYKNLNHLLLVFSALYNIYLYSNIK